MAFKEFLNTVKSEAGDAVEITKLKSKISKEKTLVKSNYQKIGEIIYNRYNEECDDVEIADLVLEITNARNKIKELNNEIDKVRMNEK